MNALLSFLRNPTYIPYFISLAAFLVLWCSAWRVNAQERGLSTHRDGPWLGISAFAIQSNAFQGKVCRNFLRAISHSAKPAIAILYNTFGRNNRCLEKFWDVTAAGGKRHLTQIHFSNEAGRRMENLDRFDLLPEASIEEYNMLLERMPRWLERTLRKRVKSIRKLVERHAGTGNFILSTGLEDNYSSDAWENLYGVLRSEWSGPISRNRVHNKWMRKQVWSRPAGVYNEFHGYKKGLPAEPPPCVANGDGQDVDFLDGSGVSLGDIQPADWERVAEWRRKAAERGCIVFLWAAKWQGFFSSGPVSKPLQRKFRFDSSDGEMVRPLLQFP
ncbi:MAG: hypothetical protein J5J00_06890 [Deltaproteobacteria bacterium]|nr:hypothetical protein [Deltaproteobacteria bacterium]